MKDKIAVASLVLGMLLFGGWSLWVSWGYGNSPLMLIGVPMLLLLFGWILHQSMK